MGWIKVEGAGNMPLGNWFVTMEDGSVGYCEVYQGANSKMGVINDHFYFDYPDVVAYMKGPEPFKED